MGASSSTSSIASSQNPGDEEPLPVALQQLLAELGAGPWPAAAAASASSSNTPPLRTRFDDYLSEDRYGHFFKPSRSLGELSAWERGRWCQVRLQVLTAIGRCRTLDTILLQGRLEVGEDGRAEEVEALLGGLASISDNSALLNLDFTYGALFCGKMSSGLREEAACVALGALLRCSRTLCELELSYAGMGAGGLGHVVSGLQANPNSALQLLVLSYNPRLGSEAACVALGALLRSSRTLRELRLAQVGMTAAGLGHVVSGLQANPNSALQLLHLSENERLGEGGGAAQIAALLDHTLCPSLRHFNIAQTGLDVAGAQMVAHALARNTLLQSLEIGFYDAEAFGMLLRTGFGETGSNGIDADVMLGNRSIIKLDVWGLTDECVSDINLVFRTNAVLEECRLACSSCLTAAAGLELDKMAGLKILSMTGEYSTEFMKKVVSSLGENETMHSLMLNDQRLRSGLTMRVSPLDMNIFPDLMQSLDRNTILKTLEISDDRWQKSGKCASVEEALRRNRRAAAYLPTVQRQHSKLIPGRNSVPRARVLDDREGLDDDMFQGLMEALQVNLGKVSFENTVWKRQGKGATVNVVLCGFPYAVQQVQHFAGSYPNQSVDANQRRGLAVILSMEDDRPGGAVDRGRLEALLQTLKFETEIMVNDSEDIKEYFTKLAKDPFLANDDCFLCCINAHGGIEEDGRQYILIPAAKKEVPQAKLNVNDDILKPITEKLYFVDDILKPITECKYLAKKPKVFMINACRGTGSLVTSKKAEGSDLEGNQVVGKTAGEVRPLHAVSDCLVVFSTSHGEQSFRNLKEGTNFITAFMEAIVKGSQTAHVLDIFTSVIGKVTEMDVWEGSERKFQCPVIYSSLTRGLYWSVEHRFAAREHLFFSEESRYLFPKTWAGTVVYRLIRRFKKLWWLTNMWVASDLNDTSASQLSTHVA